MKLNKLVSLFLLSLLLLSECFAFSTNQSKDTNYDLAVKIAEWLRTTTVNSPNGNIWVDDAINNEQISADLTTGVAGKVIFFLELHYASQKTKNRNAFLKDINQGAEYLGKNLPNILKSQISPARKNSFQEANSLYGEIAGTGFALFEAYKATRNQKYRLDAIKCVDYLINSATQDGNGISWNDNNDIWSGNAGTGLFLLYAHQETNHSKALEMAIRAGNTLLNRAIQEQNGLNWKVNQKRDFVLPNFSHGAAGVGYFLATLYKNTNDKKFLDGATAAAKFLLSIAKNDENGLLIPYSVPNEGYDFRYDVGWAHGLAGSARLFYQLFQITGDKSWLEIVDKSVIGIKNSGLPNKIKPEYGKKDFAFDMRFGSAGVANFFLNLYKTQTEKAHFDYASVIIESLLTKSTNDEKGLRWEMPRYPFLEKGNEQSAFTGYLYGASGYGVLLLRADYAQKKMSWKISFPDEPFENKGQFNVQK